MAASSTVVEKPSAASESSDWSLFGTQETTQAPFTWSSDFDDASLTSLNSAKAMDADALAGSSSASTSRRPSYHR